MGFQIPPVESKSFSMENGEQCVRKTGIWLMPMSCASSWDTRRWSSPSETHSLVKDLDLFGWPMSNALVMKWAFLSVTTTYLESLAVPTIRTSECFVEVERTLISFIGYTCVWTYFHVIHRFTWRGFYPRVACRYYSLKLRVLAVGRYLLEYSAKTYFCQTFVHYQIDSKAKS